MNPIRIYNKSSTFSSLVTDISNNLAWEIADSFSTIPQFFSFSPFLLLAVAMNETKKLLSTENDNANIESDNDMGN